MAAYYNELDPVAAEWLRRLIAAGHIAPGDVDERSIVDVRGDDLRQYRQCHFFAGIGVWSYALRRAGWPDDRPVWSASCPCQPFSDAGAGETFDDERDLWPDFFGLVRAARRERAPFPIFGEQVASADGLTWLDAVHADLEGEAYTVGAIDTCAAGFGAPHQRQRFFFVADPEGGGRGELRDAPFAWGGGHPDGGLELGVMAHPAVAGRRELEERDARADGRSAEEPRRLRAARELVDAERAGLEGHPGHGDDRDEPGRLGAPAAGPAPAAGAVGGFWADAAWVPCRDGVWRPVEPGTFPLAHGAAARVGRLRAYGNAICAPVAEEFVRAYLELTR